MSRTHTLEVWLDDLSVKNCYTISDGRRLPAPILGDPPEVAATTEGLERLIDDITVCSAIEGEQ